MSETGTRNDQAQADGGPGPLGWLASLRMRLGIPGANLRQNFEEALRTTGDTAAFTAEEREMLLRMLHFGNLKVVDVMVPRADIISIDESEPVRELLRVFDEAGVSRIPLFRDTLDDPRGMVHIKDLMSWMMAEATGRPMPEMKPETMGKLPGKPPGPPPPAGAPNAAATTVAGVDLGRPISGTRVRRPVLYVPPSMPAMNLLIRMQSTRIHMALVVDEYGGTDGLVTIEDLVEQIVGQIDDEHDEAEAAMIAEDDAGHIIAAARTPVAELERHLGVTLLTPEELSEIDTLGGLVFSTVGRVPARGELVRHASGVEFEVLDADPRRVKKLRVYRPRAATADGAKVNGAKADGVKADAAEAPGE